MRLIANIRGMEREDRDSNLSLISSTDVCEDLNTWGKFRV